jgi:hypothetical protein
MTRDEVGRQEGGLGHPRAPAFLTSRVSQPQNPKALQRLLGVDAARARSYRADGNLAVTCCSRKIEAGRNLKIGAGIGWFDKKIAIVRYGRARWRGVEPLKEIENEHSQACASRLRPSLKVSSRTIGRFDHPRI